MIAEFLVAGGHGRLGFLAGIENSSTSRDRQRGFTGCLTEHGRPPPLREVGLVGFDDTGPARWPSFSLTSFSQPLQPMVDAAVALVCEMIENPGAATHREVKKNELVVRGFARMPPEGCVSLEGQLVWRAPLPD